MPDRQGRILIVDDEATIRRLLHQKLLKEGYRCDEAGSAEEAINWLRGNSAEIVILDMQMPGKSGADLLSEIKASSPDTSVIVATAVDEGSVAIRCMKQGADDYIFKPFKLDEVMLTVEKALEKRSLELKIKEYQHHLDKVNRQTTEMRKLFLGSVEALVFALEAKDRYTAGHSQRVTENAMAMAEEMGLSPDDLEDLRCSGLLHDVGKIAVDQLIQNKPDKLTSQEYEHIMMHAHVGAGIVKPIVNETVVEIIDHHHDHYDGSGLRQTVAGDAIPLGARILAVADAFDAMTSGRPYRPAMSVREAVNEIGRCAETQFDPAVVKAFMKVTASELLRTRV